MNHRQQIFLYLLLFLGFGTGLQAQTFWQRSYGNTNQINEIHPTSDGGYIMTGLTSAFGSNDIAVVKLAGNGSVQWSKSFGNGSTHEWGTTLKVMPTGGYIVGGNTSGSQAAIIIRLDTAGNILWQHNETLAMGEVYDFLPLNDGGVIAIGQVDPNSSIMRFDSTGNIVWAKLVDAGAKTELVGGLMLSNSTFFVFGAESPNIALDGFVAKFDTNGSPMLYRRLSAASIVRDAFRTSDGNIVWLSDNTPRSSLFKSDTLFNIIWGRDYEWPNTGGRVRSVVEIPSGHLMVSAHNISGNSLQKMSGIFRMSSTGNLEQAEEINALHTSYIGRLAVNTNDDGAIYGAYLRTKKLYTDLNQVCNLTNYTTMDQFNQSSGFLNAGATVSNATPSNGTGYVTFSNFYSASSSNTCSTLICNLSASASVDSDYNGADISCAGFANGSATASATGGSNYTYLWDANAGSQTTATATNLAAGTYTVTVTDAGGCTATAQVTLTDPVGLQASATAVDASCDGNNGNATATGLGGTGAYAFQWDANAGNQSTPIATNLAGGTYSVTVTDTNGCVDTASVVVGNTSAPTANAGADTAICAGATVGLAGMGGGSYSWDQGLGSGASHSVSPSATTTYTLTVTAANGCTDTDAVQVTVNALPTANAGLDQAICIGASASLTAAGGTNYQWNNGLGAGATHTVTPTTTTQYNVTVTDANGCIDTDDVTVTVNPLPNADAGQDQAVCQGDTAFLMASGGNTYQWSSGLGSNATTTAVPTTTTTYSVTVTDLNGCSASDQVQVTIHALPTALASSDTSICDGGLVVVSASGGGTYNWSNGLGSGSAHTVMPNATTTYVVTVTDNHGCKATDDVTVTVFALPAAMISGDTVMCAGDSVTLIGSGGTTFAWSTGANSPAITVSPGTFTLYALSVTDANGCTGSASHSVLVNALPATPVITQLGADLITTAAATYQWTINGVPIPGATSQSYTPQQNGQYAVVVTNAEGCSGTSDPFPFTFVSVAAEMESLDMQLFPNPASAQVGVRLTGNMLEGGRIVAMDMTGKVLTAVPVAPWTGRQEINLQVRQWAAGMYLLKLESEETVLVKRLVIERR
ncbi:MAG: T9SS type A sorting domain-containing protein [Bacteroidota bacterium]